MSGNLTEWLTRGNYFVRFAKNCVCMFLVMVLIQPVLHVIAEHFGWGFSPARPFVSEDFWLNCLGTAIGSALVLAFLSRKRPARQ